MSRIIDTILVDDEPGCIRNLTHYLGEFCPDIRIVGTASDLDSATELINTSSFELAFLDVQLFDRNIFELIPTYSSLDFSIVFVTAYEQFALNAFRVSALDYILKPLETEEILRCYGKITRHFDGETEAPAAQLAKSARIFLRQGENVFLTNTDHIVFLRAQGFYTVVCFEHEGRLREVMLSKPINVVHQEWGSPHFLRVHRSYVINLQRVKSVRKAGSNLSLVIGEQTIPVAKRRAADFIDRFHGYASLA